MQASRWPYILILVLLAAILAACSLLSSEQPSAGILPEQPTLPPPTVIGVPTPEKVSPFPEYRLDLTLDPAQRRLAGKQRVLVPNHTGQDLDELVFRLYPNLPQYGGRMSVGPVWVDGQRGTSSLRAGDTSLVVPLEQSLAPEESVTIELTFDLDIPLKEKLPVLVENPESPGKAEVKVAPLDETNDVGVPHGLLQFLLVSVCMDADDSP